MKNCWIALVILACMAACKSGTTDNKNNADTTGNQPGKDSGDARPKNYLPIADFLKGEIKKVDSFSAGIMLKTIINQKKDSAFINIDQFNKLMPFFIVPELDSTYFSQHFTESTLLDPETETMSFIYTATDETSPLRKAFVYVVQGYANNKVSRIYLERESASGDTSISHKLTWKMNEFCQIIESKKTSNGYNAVMVKKAIWEPTAFASE